MADYGDMPFGLNDVKITNIAGSTQVDLLASQKLGFKVRTKSGELSGDDRIQAVQSIVEAVEWSLEQGGIPLAAYALMSGRTVTESGSTPNRVSTLTISGSEANPYFKIYGKSLGDDDDDTHVLLFKCKVIGDIEGELADGEFLVTKCNGIAIDDGSNGIMDIVEHETAATLPAT